MSLNREPCAVAILNGGQARRMGGADKASIRLGGQTIVDAQLAVLSSRFDSIAMVAGEHERCAGLAIPMLRDRVGGLGPLDGIAAALAWSPHPWVLVLACDMPCVVVGVVDLLLGAREADLDIVAARAGGRVQPMLALYHRRLLPVLDGRLATGQLRAATLLDSPGEAVSVRVLREQEIERVDPTMQSFRNLNRPSDLSPEG